MAWEDLPHSQWQFEVTTADQFRPPEDADRDVRFLWLQSQLPVNPDLHSEFILLIAGKITRELRISNRIYRKNLDSLKWGSQPERQRLIVERIVAPRAAALFRLELGQYLWTLKVPLKDVQQLLSMNYPPPAPNIEVASRRNRQKHFRTIAELLHSRFPDDCFQGLDKQDEFFSGEPFALASPFGGQVTDPKKMSRLMQEYLALHSSSKSWLDNASFLWDSVLHEVKRQHTEVDLEIYGRNLESAERQKLYKLLDLYQSLQKGGSKLDNKSVEELAALADKLGVKPDELLEPKGRECLAYVSQRTKAKIENLRQLISYNKTPKDFKRSPRGFFLKFLSDACRDRQARRPSRSNVES